MRIETELAEMGTAPDEFGGVVNMPACRASTILFKNLKDFETGERGEWPLPVYGRYGNPTQLALEAALAKLCGGDKAMVMASGMAAIAAGIASCVKSGDHMLVTDAIYGPARRFCEHEMARFGVETTFYDPTIGAGIASLIQPNTKLVYVESPGSLTFEMQDIKAIAAAAHKVGALVMADCTWATPLYFDAFAHDVDIVMHSATKYISGHSDLLMGVLVCKEPLYKQLLRTVRSYGACPAADNCSLALRGLRTLSARMRQHQESSLMIANWLKTHPKVEQVFYPALPGAPGYDLWKRDMTGACGLFAVRLKPTSHDKLEACINGLEHFGLGYSWGGFESLLIPCNLEKNRSASTLPGNGPLIRLHIGLEHVEDLKADLERGLKLL